MVAFLIFSFFFSVHIMGHGVGRFGRYHMAFLTIGSGVSGNLSEQVLCYMEES